MGQGQVGSKPPMGERAEETEREENRGPGREGQEGWVPVSPSPMRRAVF